jgi:hypothetical protein
MPLQGLNFFNLQDLLAKQFPNGVEKAFQNEDKEGCEVIGYLEVGLALFTLLCSKTPINDNGSRYEYCPCGNQSDTRE